GDGQGQLQADELGAFGEDVPAVVAGGDLEHGHERGDGQGEGRAQRRVQAQDEEAAGDDLHRRDDGGDDAGVGVVVVGEGRLQVREAGGAAELEERGQAV